jgi:hypothetical protein
MFASRKFRDVFSELNAGLSPAVYAAGSSIGSAIPMTGRSKIAFHLDMGSGGAASVQMLIYAAPTSAGTGSILVGSTGLAYASATSASGGTYVTEVRGEYLGDRSAGTWVFPVLSVSGASVVAAVHANGFVERYTPAYNQDTPAYVKGETLLY